MISKQGLTVNSYMLVEAIYDSKVALFSIVLNKLAASNGYMEMDLMLFTSTYMPEKEISMCIEYGEDIDVALYLIQFSVADHPLQISPGTKF